MRRLALAAASSYWMGLAALPACKHKEPAPAVEPPPQPPAPEPQSRVDNGLLGELAREAAQRTKAHPSADDVLAAFESAGLHIARKQQVLATPIGARYCVAAASKVGVNMSLCEYGTPDEAKAGREKSTKLFKALKGRTLLVQNSTLLTLMGPASPAIGTERAQAEKLFQTLTSR